MSRRVDNVQAMLVPLATGRSRLNRNAALLFLLHEVRGGFPVMDFTGLMDLAREFQNALGCCRLARVNVGKNADVSVSAQVFHVDSSVVVNPVGHNLSNITCPDAQALAGAKPGNQSKWM